MTGVGYPQLSAIIECADAAHGLRGLICADGGCTSPGDLAKEPSVPAPTSSCSAACSPDTTSAAPDLVEVNGVKKMRFYGMSSREAMTKVRRRCRRLSRPEGKEVLLDYRGPVENTLQDILGGVRSACTYVGARTLRELSKRATFVRVTQQINEVFGPARDDAKR